MVHVKNGLFDFTVKQEGDREDKLRGNAAVEDAGVLSRKLGDELFTIDSSNRSTINIPRRSSLMSPPFQ